MTIIENWEKIQDTIKQNMNSNVAYNVFIKNLQPLSIYDNILFIKAKDDNLISLIKNKYINDISRSIFFVTNKKYDLFFVSSEDEVKEIINTNEDKKNKKTLKQKSRDEDKETSLKYKSCLNKKYTFDTFVIGNNNKFAAAVASAVAKAPAEAYNPFFIYGGVGLGKTHLIHAIAHYIIENNNNMKILYTSSETFTNEMINSISLNKNEEFRNKYRNIDVLLIDDIHFLAGKERTQEEFFHTFNTLYEAKKQIIISSDRPPKEIETLEARLRSRFEWGLIADLQPPDLETRLAILRKKVDLDNINIEDEVLNYIAKNINSNIRELEGAINKIIAYSSLIHNNEIITYDIAEEALRDIINPQEDNTITPKNITSVIAEHYNIKISDIMSKKRSNDIAFPRQIIMYLCRKLTDESLPSIGTFLGGRDHTTVLYAYNKIDKLYKKDKSFRNNIDILIKKINNN